MAPQFAVSEDTSTIEVMLPTASYAKAATFWEIQTNAEPVTDLPAGFVTVQETVICWPAVVA